MDTFQIAIATKSVYSFDITETGFEQLHLWTTICTSIHRGHGELYFLQIAIEVNHHGYKPVTHISFHEYSYANVMRS